jgi:transposase InsO family protein
MDVKKLGRLRVPGHRATGSRIDHDRSRGVGYDHLHCVIDDHTRIAYVELHPREDAATNTATLERALRFFADFGLDPPEAVMTDNALVYRRSRRFRALLANASIIHIRTPIYTPRWNGKVERFIRTLQDEWAYSRTWPNSNARARSLQSFIRYYNRRRPHSSLGHRPPISRVHNLRGTVQLAHSRRRPRSVL